MVILTWNEYLQQLVSLKSSKQSYCHALLCRRIETGQLCLLARGTWRRSTRWTWPSLEQRYICKSWCSANIYQISDTKIMQFFDRSIFCCLITPFLGEYGRGWDDCLWEQWVQIKTSPTPRLIFIQVGFKSWHLFHYYDCLNVCSNLQWNTCILKRSRHQQYVQSLCCGGLQALGHGVVATILLARSLAGPGFYRLNNFVDHMALKKGSTLSTSKKA